MTISLTSVGARAGLDDVIVSLAGSGASWVAGDTVTVNGSVVYTLTSSDATLIGGSSEGANFAYSPASAGTYSVQINSADGTQHSQSLNFTVASEAAPTLSSLDVVSPYAGDITGTNFYAGQVTGIDIVGTNFVASNAQTLFGDSVTVSGPGLSKPVVIAVGTYDASTNTYSTTNGGFNIGSLGLTSSNAGTYTIQVNSPEGTQHSGTLSFTVLPDLQAQISTVTTGVVSGEYDCILLTGNNFQEGDSVFVTAPDGSSAAFFRLSFGYTGTNVPLPGLWSTSTQIQFVANAAAAGTYKVEVDSPDGTLKAITWFTATQQNTPQTATLTSLNAYTFSSDNVTQTMALHGTNFQSGAYLEFDASTSFGATEFRVVPTFVSSTELDYQFNAATMNPADPFALGQGTIPAADSWTVEVVNPGAPLSNSVTFYTGTGDPYNPYQRVTISSSGMTINLDFVKADNPTATFEQEVEAAASKLVAAIHNNITLNFVIDYSGTGGGAETTETTTWNAHYSDVLSYLQSQNAPGSSWLATTTTHNANDNIGVYDAQAKMMGLMYANDAGSDDGNITFDADIPSQVMVGVALHELTHAMGRYGNDLTNIFNFYTVLNPSTALYNFSLDGGQTILANYGSADPADFLNNFPVPTLYGFDPTSNLTPNDPFDQEYDGTTVQNLTSLDLTQMAALGFNTSGVGGSGGSLSLSFSGPLTEGGTGTLVITDSVAPTTAQTYQISVTSGTAPASSIVGLPTSVTIQAGQTTVNENFQIKADPLATSNQETFTVAVGTANTTGNIAEFVTGRYVFTLAGSSFTYNPSPSQMTGSGTVNIALAAAPSTLLVTAQSATATYDASKFNASGTFYEDVTGHNYALFKGALTLPYSGNSTSSVTDNGAFAGKFDLGGLPVIFNQLTFQTGAVLAGFSLKLTFPGTSNSITVASPAGVSSGLLFNNSGVQLNLGGTLQLPSAGPVSVFGMFTGSLSNASLSYLANTDTLQLQGTFTASQILGSSLQATVNFSGSNYIQYQGGNPVFNGNLTITGLSGSKAGFGITEVDLNVNTKAQNFGGALAFTVPFGAAVTKDKVTVNGGWSNGQAVINSVGVSFSGLAVPVPFEPALVWTSASVSIASMFTPNTPTTFSGSLGFGFGPQLAGNYVGSLSLSGSGSSQQLTGSAQIQLVPYSFVSSIAGGSLSGLQSIFPLLSATDQVTVNFSNSKFDDFAFTGTTSILGNFITTSQSFKADSNLDFTISGNSTVNFGNSAFGKLINTSGLSFGGTESTNYLVKYSATAALSSDYAAAWFNDTISWGLAQTNFTFGAKVDFAGDFSLLYAAPGAATNSGAAAGAAVASGVLGSQAAAAVTAPTYLFLTASWTNAATQPVTISVTDPNGNVIPQSSFAADGIAVVTALTTSYQETLAILNPVATTGWQVSVTGGGGNLGTVTVTLAVPDTTPTISGLSFGTLNANGNLSFQYSVANATTSTVSFYADQDGTNFDGVLLGQSGSLANGSNSTTVSLTGLGTGQWHFYALISDGISAPQEVYAPNTLAIAAPSISVTSNTSARPSQALALSSLVTVNDPTAVGYQQLELWDSNGTAAGGQLVVNGTAQAGGQAIYLGPTDLANTVFDVGTSVGTDTLWAQLIENDGTASGWQQFTVGVTNPTLGVTSVSAPRGQVINLSSLVTISDSGNLGYQKLELWDSNGTAAGGQFKINGVAQAGGHEIDVTAANFAGTVFDVGTTGGTDTLWAQLVQNDGTLSGWKQFAVSSLTPPALAVSSITNATKGQVINLSSLVTISDPSGVGYQKLELWDSNGTAAGGEFKINGAVEPAGQIINVTPANVANTVFDAGTSAGSDTLWAELVQNDGTLSGWKQFSVTVPTPTLSVSSTADATKGQVISLASLITIADPGNVGYQTLELWDSNGTVAGGEFQTNGTVQPGRQTINITPANVANTVFDAGTSAGTDVLWAQLVENDGTLSGWKQFSVSVVAPTLNVSSIAATKGQVISLAGLINIADPGNVGYQTLELWDSNGTAAGGEFLINGTVQPGRQTINVTPANVANTVFDAGTSAGTDILWAQLVENDGTLSGWKQFSVSVAPPTLAVSSIASAAKGQVINLANLVSITDPNNIGYQKLELWDSNGTAAGGEFKINGTVQPGRQTINVTPTNVANTVFDAGTSGGSDTLWAQLVQNDGSQSGWMQFSVTVPTPTLSVNNYNSATPGQVINLSNLLTVTDPGNVGYQQLELWDSNGTAATGQFMVNGAAQTGGHEIDISQANVANTVFDEGTTGNTDTLWARLMQNDGTLTPWQQFTVVDPLDIASGATLDLNSAYAGTVNFLGATGILQLDNSNLFTGTVAGMTGADTIDFRDIGFAGQPTFAATSAGGVLGLADGVHAARIQLLGDYNAASFVASSDGHGGTSIALFQRLGG